MERATILVKNGCFRPKSAIFNGLKGHYDKLHITHFERYPDDYLTIMDELDIDREVIISVLESRSISVDQTTTFLSSLKEEIKFNSAILKKVSKTADDNPTLHLETEMIQAILMEVSIAQKQRLKVFCKYVKKLDTEFISRFLMGLDSPYSVLSDKKKRPLIERSRLNKDLLRKLWEKGFISNFREEDQGYRVYHKKANE